MKTIFLSLFLLGIHAVSRGQQTLTIPQIPAAIEAFTELRDRTATSPEGGAAMYVVAMLMYAKNKELGMQALIVASHKQLLVESSTDKAYKGFFPTPGYDNDIRNYFGPKPYIAHSYINGTKPEDSYKLPAGALQMTFTRNAYSEMDNGDVKVFVKCSGAASPRPITLRQNDKGLWKVTNYSSLFVGVMTPGKEVDDL